MAGILELIQNPRLSKVPALADMSDLSAVPAHGSNEFNEQRRRQLFGSRNVPNPQPTRQEQFQAFLDHISARYHRAQELKMAGKLDGSGFTQEDIDRAEAVFGKQILEGK